MEKGVREESGSPGQAGESELSQGHRDGDGQQGGSEGSPRPGLEFHGSQRVSLWLSVDSGLGSDPLTGLGTSTATAQVE